MVSSSSSLIFSQPICLLRFTIDGDKFPVEAEKL
jgi:hypothetical protein